MKALHVPILIETEEDGIFIVSCPQFKGCHSSGKRLMKPYPELRK
jgi:predicted RNase H-like HicB family nuclease